MTIRKLESISYSVFGIKPWFKKPSHMSNLAYCIHRFQPTLTLSLVPYICVSESVQHCFRKWLVAYSAPSHYLNQCRVIINWIIRNKFQWNFNQNTKLLIHENAFENIVSKMMAILSMGRWVKHFLWQVGPRTVLLLRAGAVASLLTTGSAACLNKDNKANISNMWLPERLMMQTVPI